MLESDLYDKSELAETSMLAQAADLPEYDDDAYLRPEFRDLEVIFGEHWLKTYVPDYRQKYELFYEEGESLGKLPAHCRDASGRVYRVIYETNSGMMSVYLKTLSFIDDCSLRLCLIPGEFSDMIPSHEAKSDDQETEDYSEYVKQSKQDKFMDILKSRIDITPQLCSQAGIPRKFYGVTLSKLATLLKKDDVEISQSIGENIVSVCRFAKQYRWNEMISQGRKLGVDAGTIASYVPRPAAKVKKSPVNSNQLELFPEATDYSEMGIYPQKMKGLVLYGDMGTLKTSLAVAFMKTAMAVDIRCQMVNLNTFAEDYMNGKGAASRRNNLSRVPILLLDSLGKERCRRRIAALLEDRYNKNLLTIITTNLTPEEIADKYSPDTWDRIREVSTVLHFQGKSLREKE